MSLIRQSRGGRENDTTFGTRMKGEGLFADMIGQRFRKTCAKLGLNARNYQLDLSHFRVPAGAGANVKAAARAATPMPQMSLF